MKIKAIVRKQPNGDYCAEIPTATHYALPDDAYEITAIVHKEADGYWAECEGLVGCATQGDNLEELKFNICEAVAGYLSVDDSELQLLSRAASQVSV